ncbi:hypothetical protein QBC46DRAFT_283287 [Diplogelasinospora grovesii]|uniref:Uncharacterized protein n=1 Tax=Diplogelasinospora grovesii TaxID=303347 RepID=A0AAN6S7B7_9PEZI|nr:hypothetical protein QBC46DRAFT_283287 [Diplogelasinospora grovesii]
MSGFPKLIPAFTAQLEIHPPSTLGPAVAKGAGLVHVAIVQEAGSLRSEPGYPIKLDGVFLHGADYIRVDEDQKNVRLEVQCLARDNTTKGLVRLNYTGTIGMSGAAGKVLRGEADAGTTGFGESFIQPEFETGCPELAELQSKVYVGAGRFIIEPGKNVIVEYKISEVVA